jgi:tetratricopeptide (TPR) repeat protein
MGSFQRMIQIVGHLGTVEARLKAKAEVSQQQMAEISKELDELESLAALPGAEMMHRKYSSLLHPYLRAYGLRAGASTAPPWDPVAAIREVTEQFQRTNWASQVMDYTHHLAKVVDRLQAGADVPQDELAPLIEQLQEMQTATEQLRTEHPQLPGMFSRFKQRLAAQLGEREMRAGHEQMQSVYKEGADLAPVLETYKRAVGWYEMAGDVAGQGVAALGLAHAYQVAESAEGRKKAEAYYRQASNCFREVGDQRKECQVLYSWASLCQERDHFAQARKLCQQGIRVAQAAGDGSRESEGQRMLGKIAEREGKPERAIACYQSALQIAEQGGHTYERLASLICLGSLHSSLANPGDTIEYCQQALDLADEENYREERANILVQMYFAHRELGQPEEARTRRKELERLAQGHFYLARVVNSLPAEEG